jgi:hypothetical protein
LIARINAAPISGSRTRMCSAILDPLRKRMEASWITQRSPARQRRPLRAAASLRFGKGGRLSRTVNEEREPIIQHAGRSVWTERVLYPQQACAGSAGAYAACHDRMRSGRRSRSRRPQSSMRLELERGVQS